MNEAARGVLKRSLTIAGHATSVSLEAPFWEGLAAMARRRGLAVATLVAEIDAARDGLNLSSALRVAVLRDAETRAGEAARDQRGEG